jgi:hypothetical protein
MLIARIQGSTRELGRAQGYLTLPVRDVVVVCPVSGDGTPAMETAWTPTPDELARLNAGASIVVRLAGQVHPPIMVEVGEPPEEEEGVGGNRREERQ